MESYDEPHLETFCPAIVEFLLYAAVTTDEIENELEYNSAHEMSTDEVDAFPFEAGNDYGTNDPIPPTSTSNEVDELFRACANCITDFEPHAATLCKTPLH